MKATEVTAGLAESNGSLLPGLWRDSLARHLLADCLYTPGSAAGPTLGNEYGKTLHFYWSRDPPHPVNDARGTAACLPAPGRRLAADVA